MIVRLARRAGIGSVFVGLLLIIEFFDEFVFGVREAAWPLLREDLNLSYTDVGLLLTVPILVSTAIEPVMGIVADIHARWKRRLILWGGVVMAASLLIAAASHSFALLMLAFIIMYPASGAFVSLAQAALMDTDPPRHQQNMARWTFAGSIGVTAGPIVLSLALAFGSGWRELFVTFALLALLIVFALRRVPFASEHFDADEDAEPDEPTMPWRQRIRETLALLRNREVLRWSVLLTFSDLMLDILLAYVALYLVDVVGLPPEQAALAITVWSIVGLVGDFLIIPILERVDGVGYLRVSAAVVSVLYPAFLLIEPFAIKLAILGLLGFFNAGWYSVLQGKLYTALPGRSGTALAIDNVFGIADSALPLIIGATAGAFGLDTAMWLLMAGPIALLAGLPRKQTQPARV